KKHLYFISGLYAVILKRIAITHVTSFQEDIALYELLVTQIEEQRTCLTL
ncbi:hypothetical protein ACJX0J_035468, partial [Zea mays]